MESWTLPVVSVLALGAVMWTMYRGGNVTHTFDTPKPLPDLPSKNKANKANKVVKTTPAPASVKKARGDTDDLDAVLAGVLDTALPVTPSPMRESVPYTDEEIRQIVDNVLARVNDVSDSSWDLRLVALDGIRKTVDGYKTLLYELSFAVYSPPRNIGIKLSATVVVPPTNMMYVQQLHTFNAAMTDDAVRGSRGPQNEVEHAEWVPIL